MQPVPDSGDGNPSRFLGRETLEKPDNDLSITPHLSVGKGFGASPAKVFDPVQSSSEKLQFSSDKVWQPPSGPREPLPHATGRG